MPRLAASVAAFVVIAFGIGFNMVRYPIVWDLVGATSDFSQSRESEQPETAVEPSASAPPETTPEPQNSWRTAQLDYASEEFQAAPPREEDAADPIVGDVHHGTWGEGNEEDEAAGIAVQGIVANDMDLSRQATPWQKPAYRTSSSPTEELVSAAAGQCDERGCRLPMSTQWGAHAAYPAAGDPQEPTAELKSRGRLVPVTPPKSQAASPEPVGAEPPIRLLPPVGQTDRTATGGDLPGSDGGPVPFYPSTGIEAAAL